MPTPRKPQALREIQGTAKDHPGRQNGNQPEIVRGIGPAPAHFKEDQKDIWDYLVSIMFAGVLSESDRPTLEVLTVLFWRFRYGSYEEDSIIPALAVGELARMDSIMSRYGMTPSDRTKIVVPDQSKKNKFSTL